MLSRLAIVLMLILLPLQWGLAQAHDSADEIRAVALQSLTGQIETIESDGPHSQEPGGVCGFHELAHTVALASAQDAALASPLTANTAVLAGAAPRLAAGPPADIERPKWPHHGFSVVSPPASVQT